MPLKSEQQIQFRFYRSSSIFTCTNIITNRGHPNLCHVKVLSGFNLRSNVWLQNRDLKAEPLELLNHITLQIFGHYLGDLVETTVVLICSTFTQTELSSDRKGEQ